MSARSRLHAKLNQLRDNRSGKGEAGSSNCNDNFTTHSSQSSQVRIPGYRQQGEYGDKKRIKP